MSKAGTVALFDALVARFQGIERRGAAIPYTSLNGHMFSMLTPEGSLALRLPEPARSTFLIDHASHLCEQNGVVLKEYVVVPDQVFGHQATIDGYFQMSIEYVASLKPKATTRKKTAKKAGKKTAKKAGKKAGKKTAKKAGKKTAKKAGKKIGKKRAKKVGKVSKVSRKAVRKLAKTSTKKVGRKTAKKTMRKVAKKAGRKVARKTTRKKSGRKRPR